MGIIKFAQFQEFSHRLSRLETLVNKWNQLLENLAAPQNAVNSLQSQIDTLKNQLNALQNK